MNRTAADQKRRTEALLEEAISSLPEETIDIAAVRDRLIGAERGLGIDRISLDFRPEPNAKRSGGGKIHASLGGSFDAVYHYLDRVESLRLPLAPEEVTLRPDTTGRILLTTRWTALWDFDRGREPGVFQAGDLERLGRWLTTPAGPGPNRDPFSRAEPPRTAGLRATAPMVEARPADAPVAARPLPQLAGFVLARPELETDVSLRVLAALRFQGELKLSKVGDVVGGFRVERIEARESVLLVDEETGERLELRLE